MLVVIPTYKRIESLKWVLLSLLQAEIPKTKYDCCICLLNNYPPARQEIEELVCEIKASVDNSKLWIWKLVHREKTIPAIENWYSGIDEIAKDGEIVFLHGDDDLFLPWSLTSRCNAILDQDADLLLSKSIHGLVFLPDKKSIYIRGNFIDSRNENRKSTHLTWKEIASWGPAFIGNHCYRNTKKYRDALSLCYQGCDDLSWLDWNTRTLMIPYYLPFAIKFIEGKLACLNASCVIRGSSLKEKLNSPFGVPGWNSGFLGLTAYLILNNKDLSANIDLNETRIGLSEFASSWYFTFFIDNRIAKDKLQKTLDKAIEKNFSFSWSAKSLVSNFSLIRFNLVRPLIYFYHNLNTKRFSQDANCFVNKLVTLDLRD